MNVIEKYTRALHASNLRDDAHHCQTEVLAAVALAGGLGSTLFRLKYASTESSVRANYANLLSAWFKIVQGKGVKRDWPSHVSTSAVARTALEHWLNDLCPDCGGKGHLPLPEVPNVLRDEDCAACGGNGKKPVRCNGRMLKYVTDMVECLDAMSAHAAAGAARRLVAAPNLEEI